MYFNINLIRDRNHNSLLKGKCIDLFQRKATQGKNDTQLIKFTENLEAFKYIKRKSFTNKYEREMLQVFFFE